VNYPAGLPRNALSARSKTYPAKSLNELSKSLFDGLRLGRLGIDGSMPIALLLIIIGIVLAIVVNYALGIICIVIGLVLLLWPRISAGRSARV
jgi:hypothetical protein